MKPGQPNESTGSYFALLRLVEKWRGRSAVRSEGNWLEAYLAGICIYLISYIFAANLWLPHLRWWQAVIALFVLVFVMCVFWLAVLHVNSLLVKLSWTCGLCPDLPANRIQSVLIGIVTTALAAQLLADGSWLWWIGALWITAVALNLAAAFLLALLYDERS